MQPIEEGLQVTVRRRERAHILTEVFMTLNLLSALHQNRLGSFENRLQKLKSELLSETPRKWVLFA